MRLFSTIVLTVLLATATASAEVICKGGFEPRDTKQWTRTPKAGGVAGVPEPARGGTHALESYGSNSAQGKATARIASPHPPKSTAEATGRSFGWRVYFPNQLVDGHHCVGYFEARNIWNQVMAFEAN